MTKGGETFATLIGRLMAAYAKAIVQQEVDTAGLLESQIGDLERRAIVHASWQQKG